MGDRVTQKPITTISGRYYAGESAQTAKKRRNYKKIVGMDFKDIDTDHNGRLSDKEICDARDKEVQRYNKRIDTLTSGGILAFTGAIGGLMIAGTVFGDDVDGLNGKTLNQMGAEQAKTDAYRKAHYKKAYHLNVKM